MFQILYVLAAVFLGLCLVFWLLAVVFHVFVFMLSLVFHILLPVAIIIFIVGLIKNRKRT